MTFSQMWRLQTPLQKTLLITAGILFVAGVVLAVVGLVGGGR